MITLTKDEYKKFAAWLRQEVDTHKALLEQMEKIKVPESVKRMQQAAINIKTFLAKELESVEEQVINESIIQKDG